MNSGPDTGQVLAVETGNLQDGQRLDQALSELTGLSRSHIQQLLKQHQVEGPYSHTKASQRVKAGEAYQITVRPPEPLNLEPEAIALDILFEDEHLLVINKPAGIVVHPSAGHSKGTLVHALLHHCPDLPGINGIQRPGIVHRLDKDTSGALAVAKTEAAHHGLSGLFARHDIKRQYLAWCRGAPNWGQRRIEEPIGRHRTQRKKMSVIESGKPAVTDVLVERRYQDFCRLRLTLHTGRTHQIRVHLSHLNMPILGDQTYARAFKPGKQVPEPARSTIAGLKRQALHAEILGFLHPVTGQQVNCIAPLPADLQNLADALEASYE